MSFQIKTNLNHINTALRKLETVYHRPPHSVSLLAVSKGQTINAICEAIEFGQKDFAENYVQEAVDKISLLQTQYPYLIWHFIGQIQSNKTKLIAEYFAWAHSIDRLSIAKRLNEQRPYYLPKLNVCIQAGFPEEPHKGGVEFTKVADLAAEIIKFPRLSLRGLMFIPPATNAFATQCSYFEQAHELFRSLQKLGFPLDTLSMGMSNDFEAAIANGSTLVRIGTAIFGQRP